jgi:hypothetical protein
MTTHIRYDFLTHRPTLRPKKTSIIAASSSSTRRPTNPLTRLLHRGELQQHVGEACGEVLPCLVVQRGGSVAVYVVGLLQLVQLVFGAQALLSRVPLIDVVLAGASLPRSAGDRSLRLVLWRQTEKFRRVSCCQKLCRRKGKNIV